MTVTARNYNDTSPAQQLQSSVAASLGTTSLPVASIVGFPAVPFLLAVDRGTASQEVCLCTAVVGGGSPSFTVQRAYDGSPVQFHNIGAAVEHTSAAIDFNQANAFIVSCGTVAPSALTPGGSAVNGATQVPADAAHQHALPPFGTGESSSSTPGDSAADGSSAHFARADHVHARESRAGIVAIDAGLASSPLPNSLPCDGRSLATGSYPALFARLQYSWGGSGSSFNLPNFQGYVPAGTGGTLALGFTGKSGATTQTLSTANMAPHLHGGVTQNHNSDHTHQTPSNMTIWNINSTLFADPTPGPGGIPIAQGPQETTSGTSNGHTHNFLTDAGQGSSTPVSIVQPTVGVNYIIWTK